MQQLTPRPAPSPLLREDIADQVRQALLDSGSVTLRLEDAPPSFRLNDADLDGWRLRLDRETGQSILVRVRGLAYSGEDPERRAAFAVPPAHDGFIPVARVRHDPGNEMLAGVEEILEWNAVEGSERDRHPEKVPGGHPLPDGPFELVEERDAVEAATPETAYALDEYGVEMVTEAREGRLRRPLHRDDELEALITALSKKHKPTAVLLGMAGVGKNMVMEGLALRIAEGDVPEALRDLRIYSINLSKLSAGASRQNEAEGRWSRILEAAKAREDVILFVDEIHLICDPRSDFAQMSKEDLGRGAIRIVGATTHREWRTVASDPALSRRFEEIAVHELVPEHAGDVVLDRIEGLELHHGVAISEEVARRATMKAKHAAPNRVLPDIAIDLLDHAAAIAAVEGDAVLEERHIHGVISHWRGLPADQLGLERPRRAFFDRLSEALNERILGQERSIGSVVENLWLQSQRGSARAVGVRGSFICAGLTGTGKTELARALAAEMFGPDRLIRIDCSTLQKRHHVDRLVGSPPGYVGSDLGGELTNQVRDKGFGVILLDELEKGHPSVADNLLLPMLDEGYVLDQNTGERLDVSHFVILATTNLGTDIEDSLHRDENVRSWTSAGARHAVERHFRPEVINRFDAILTFDPLSEDVHREIIQRETHLLTQDLGQQGPPVSIEVSGCAEDLVLRQEARELRRNGARATKRVFERRIAHLVLRALSQVVDASGTVRVFASEGSDRLATRFIPMDPSDFN